MLEGELLFLVDGLESTVGAGEVIAAAHESGDVAQLLGVVEEHSDVFVLAPQPVDP